MSPDRERLTDELRESGALRTGHFELSSGRHARQYVQCALLLELPERARRAGEDLAEVLGAYRPDCVVSPALGGMIIGHETAAALGVPFRFTERKDGAMTLRRGFEIASGSRVVVIEDVVTTGGSAREAIAVVEALGGQVVAAGAIIDRSGEAEPFTQPFEALLELSLESFPPEECPLCAAGGQAEKPGSRAGSGA
jgi:orotate phosphoribosyltransferase